MHGHLTFLKVTVQILEMSIPLDFKTGIEMKEQDIFEMQFELWNNCISVM